MRKTLLLVSLLLVFLPAATAQSGLDCFAVIAGKGCTADGSVLFAHNEDDDGDVVVRFYRFERQRHAPGSVLTLKGGGAVPQPEETLGGLWSQMPGFDYSDIYLNDHGVAVASNACTSREDKPELTDGGIGYDLRHLVGRRARTAREGVEIAIAAVAKFGYADSGRLLAIADPGEAWVICLVRGKHWVAARVPDDRVLTVANTYPIRLVDPADRENFRVSPGLIEHAKSRGWYVPERDGPFDFARAYASPAARTDPRNFRRQWRAIRLLAEKPPEEGWDLPAFVSPQKKLAPADLMAVLRDHYEGTERDLTDAYRKGTPNRTAERTLCTDSTRNAVVFQLRADLPVEVGALMWVAMRRPDGSVFLPWYVGIREVPPGFADGDPATALAAHFAPEATRLGNPESFQVFHDLCDALDDAYGERFPAVRKLQDELERGFFRWQPEIERLVASTLRAGDREAARDLLTAYVLGQTARAVHRAGALAASFPQSP
ncbi:MAG: C69 family dipeptidase [Planctomycetes bacterium]|nr:C69 family dipeptidase [Planctomycetota bacterium]